MEKDSIMMLRHFKDLSHASEQRSIPVFSDFLNLNEQSILLDHKRDFFTSFLLFGGRDGCERQIACFIPDSFDTEDTKPVFPIACIRISIPGARFSKSSLTHRDYLGSVLGLGIDRSKIGDIIVEDKGACLFCTNQIAPLLLEEWNQVGRMKVVCTQINAAEALGKPRFEEVKGTISSERLDAILGVAFHLSRSVSSELIENGFVFVNSRQVLRSHFVPTQEDQISVKGYGKFRYEGVTGTSKKGRLGVSVMKYI